MSGWGDGASGWNDGGATSNNADWGATKTAPAGGDDWNGGQASTGNDNWDGAAPAVDGFPDQGGYAAFNGGGFGGAITCRSCNKEGHKARECPDNPNAGAPGACFNCGEEGHNKADCPKPRVFKGTCRICSKEGHPAAECPDKPPVKCRNCKEEGHEAAECKNNRKFDNHDALPQLTPDEAWEQLAEADKTRDLDMFRKAVQIYGKAFPQVTYRQIEETLRDGEFNVHLIGTEKELPKTMTFINLQGELNKTYQVGFHLSAEAPRPRMEAKWPKSPEENLQRLDDAGLPFDRGVPYCIRCKEIGHSSKKCPEEAEEWDGVKIMCVNCDTEGHRARDCPEPRKGKKGPMTCRNCGQEGHKKDECTEPPNLDNVTCRKCEETGHFAKDCPNEKCRNCDKPGHSAKECEEPRNMANVICRNCDETGHFSKECPKPRDYSRVECSNCHQKGHTKVRCKEPSAESNNNEDDGGVKLSSGGDWSSEGDATTNAKGWDTGPDTAAFAPTTGEDSWGAGGGGGW